MGELLKKWARQGTRGLHSSAGTLKMKKLTAKCKMVLEASRHLEQEGKIGPF